MGTIYADGAESRLTNRWSSADDPVSLLFQTASHCTGETSVAGEEDDCLARCTNQSHGSISCWSDRGLGRFQVREMGRAMQRRMYSSSSCLHSRDRPRLNKSGVRTLFRIECQRCKWIQEDDDQDEILLLPGTRFQVTHQEQIDLDQHVIDLQEILTDLQRPLELNDVSIIEEFVDDSTVDNHPAKEHLFRHRTDTKISFAGQSLTVDDMHQIADELPRNQFWSSLCLRRTSLGQTQLKILIEVLQSHCCIAQLDLSDNRLEDVDLQLISASLKTNQRLVKLSLDGVGITIDGVRALSELIRFNSTLHSLSLKRNHIDDERMTSLISGLKENQTLTSLDLTYNQLTDASLPNVIDLLKTASRLTHLYLDRNHMTGEAKEMIHRTIEMNLVERL